MSEHYKEQVRRADGTFGPKRSGGGDAEQMRLAVNKLQGALNSLSSRMDLARKAGEQFDGNRRLWKTLGYPWQDTEVGFNEMLGKYLRSDVATRIVDAPAQTAWRRGVDVVEVDGDGNEVKPEGETEFERDVRTFFDQVDFVERSERIDRVAGIGRYAVGLLVSTKADDLEAPLADDDLEEPEDIGRYAVYRQDHAEIEEFVDAEDVGNPRIGLPEFYEITLVAGKGDEQDEVTETVHWSRVIHVAEDPMEDDIWGRPRMENVFNRLEDLAKISGGSAEMFWSNVGGLLHIAADKDVDFESSDPSKSEADVLEEFADNILEALHEQRRTVGTKGMELEHVGAGTPDPRGIFQVLKALISAGRGMPQNILFGQETGERASSKDLEEWLGRISERQTRFNGPVMVRQPIDRLIEAEAITPPEVGYEVRWPSLYELDESERAEIAQARASAASAAVDAVTAGGETGIEIVRALVPEMEQVFDEDRMQELEAFVEETEGLEREDLERYLENGDREEVTA